MDSISQLYVHQQLAPRETHPLIENIFQTKNREIKLLLKKNNIDGNYPCEKADDDITPLIASIICHDKNIFSDLLLHDANPNQVSDCGWTPLHYVSLYEASIDFVRHLLEGKADPNGRDPTPLQVKPSQSMSPLHVAVLHNRADVVAELISAGALVTTFPGVDPERNSHNEKMCQMIHDLAKDSNSEAYELCSKIQHFLDMVKAVKEKPAEEVFKCFGPHMLLEEPQSHLVMIEILFTLQTGQRLADECRQEAMKWLKENAQMYYYIEDAARRLPDIPETYVMKAIDTLNSVFCTMGAISDKQAQPIITKLQEQLCSKNKPDQRKAVLQALYMITQKTKAALDWDPIFIEQLFSSISPFIDEQHSYEIRVYTYGVFANLLSAKNATSILTKLGITSVPDNILTQAGMKRDAKLKEALGRFNDCLSEPKQVSVQESALNVQPSHFNTPKVQMSQKWQKKSKRWRDKLHKLLGTDEHKRTRVGAIMYVDDEEFCIARGRDGTDVFLGLRDDGIELAIKRKLINNDQSLKKEGQILALTKLDDCSIVRYLYATEGEKYGYLGLQLCEYTLEEKLKEGVDLQTKTDWAFQLLKSLRVLHVDNPQILHRDLKPKNVLIDVLGKVRLADFGKSRQLLNDQTPSTRESDGRRCWLSRETLEEEEAAKNPYKASSDIQVAGMLEYYILTGGNHPFEGSESNIRSGKFSLVDLKDIVAVDLIENMLHKEPDKRHTVEECLSHPFFWNSQKRLGYVKEIGNKDEVEIYQKADKEKISMEGFPGEGSYESWKGKFPAELVKEMEKKRPPYTDHIFGLLRFIRNMIVHYPKEAAKIDVFALFPDLFGSVYKFSKIRGWNSVTPVKEMFQGEDISNSSKSLSQDLENLHVSAEESNNVSKSVRGVSAAFSQLGSS